MLPFRQVGFCLLFFVATTHSAFGIDRRLTQWEQVCEIESWAESPSFGTKAEHVEHILAHPLDASIREHERLPQLLHYVGALLANDRLCFQALPWQRAAYELAQEKLGHHHRQTQQTARALVACLAQTGNAEELETLMEFWLAFPREKLVNEGRWLKSLGETATELGRYELALELTQEALAYYMNKSQNPGKQHVKLALNLAVLSSNAGRYHHAQLWHDWVQEHHTLLDARDREKATLGLASTLMHLRLWRQAETVLRTLEAEKESSARGGQINLMLGRAALKQNALTEAQCFLAAGIDAMMALPEDFQADLSTAFALQSQLSLKEDNPPEALQWALEALIWGEPFPKKRHSALLRVGEALEAAGKYHHALPYVLKTEAFRLESHGAAHPRSIYSTLSRARIELRLGMFDSAHHTILEARDRLQSLEFTELATLSDDDFALWLAGTQEIAKLAVSYLQSRENLSQQEIWELWACVRYRKGLLQWRPELARERHAEAQRLDAEKLKRSLAEREKASSLSNDTGQLHLSTVSQSFQDTPSLRMPNETPLEISPEMTVLDFYEIGGTTAVFALNGAHRKFSFHALGKRDFLSKAVRHLYKKVHSSTHQLQRPNSTEEDVQKALGLLGRQLLPDLIELSEDTSKWRLCLDGSLHGVPWEALPLKDGYLYERVEIYRELTPFPGPKPVRAERKSALILQPEYRRTSFSFWSKLENVLPLAIVRRASECVPPEVEIDLSDLPLARSEARSVKTSLRRLLSKEKVHLLTGTEASADKLRYFSSPSFIHLPAHGYSLRACLDTASGFQERSGERDGLKLCGLFLNSNSAPGEIELMTAREISSLDLEGTELVTLAACQTSIGSTIPVEGTWTVQRAFHQAGASVVIGALWEVKDRDAHDFMVAFYKAMEKNDNVNEALDSARSEMRKRESSKVNKRNTASWAAFTALGGSN